MRACSESPSKCVNHNKLALRTQSIRVLTADELQKTRTVA
jgi:hypothetical protein